MRRAWHSTSHARSDVSVLRQRLEMSLPIEALWSFYDDYYKYGFLAA